MRDLIINTPSLQSLWQRYASIIFTFLFWGIWFFLWIPIVTVVAWYFGFSLVYFEMFEMGGYETAIDDFSRFLTVVALLGGSLSVWASYNYFRFRGVDRRAAQKPVTQEEIADFFEIEYLLLKKAKHANLVSVSFDEDGKIIDIK